MGNQLETQNNMALIHTLRTQGQQSEVLAEAMERIYGVEERVNEVATAVDNKMDKLQGQIDESFALHEDLSKQITVNYDQQKDIQSIVSKKATNMTKEHQKNLNEVFSDNMFKAYKGLFTRRIYAKLKKQMNVVRYTSVKKVDCEEAMTFLRSLEYQDFTDRELKPTPKILEIKMLEQEV